jgi:hypothetical protein
MAWTERKVKNVSHDQRMIEVKLRFWTANVGEPGSILQKHAWTNGVVRMEPNEMHGIRPGAPRTFQSLSELSGVVEKVLIKHGITLHLSNKSLPKTQSSPQVSVPIPDEQEHMLEEFGVENARFALFNDALPAVEKEIVWRWLREKDAARQQSDRAFRRWTLIATIIAAVAATVGAIAILASLFGL